MTTFFDVQECVFEHLRIGELLRLRRTCLEMAQIVRTSSIWHKIHAKIYKTPKSDPYAFLTKRIPCGHHCRECGSNAKPRLCVLLRGHRAWVCQECLNDVRGYRWALTRHQIRSMQLRVNVRNLPVAYKTTPYCTYLHWAHSIRESLN